MRAQRKAGLLLPSKWTHLSKRQTQRTAASPDIFFIMHFKPQDLGHYRWCSRLLQLTNNLIFRLSFKPPQGAAGDVFLKLRGYYIVQGLLSFHYSKAHKSWLRLYPKLSWTPCRMKRLLLLCLCFFNKRSIKINPPHLFLGAACCHQSLQRESILTTMVSMVVSMTDFGSFITTWFSRT